MGGGGGGRASLLHIYGGRLPYYTYILEYTAKPYSKLRVLVYRSIGVPSRLPLTGLEPEGCGVGGSSGLYRGLEGKPPQARRGEGDTCALRFRVYMVLCHNWLSILILVCTGCFLDSSCLQALRRVAEGHAVQAYVEQCAAGGLRHRIPSG